MLVRTQDLRSGACLHAAQSLRAALVDAIPLILGAHLSDYKWELGVHYTRGRLESDWSLNCALQNLYSERPLLYFFDQCQARVELESKVRLSRTPTSRLKLRAMIICLWPLFARHIR